MATFAQEKIYVDVTIPKGTYSLVFPDSVIGGVKPGALDNLAEGSNIIWGSNMEQEIEPGVIGNNVSSLMLGAKYKHPISPSSIPKTVSLYIHADNIDSIDLIPRDWIGCIYLWRSDRPFETTDFPDTSYIDVSDIRSKRVSSTFNRIGTVYIVDIFKSKLPPLTPVTKITGDCERIIQLEGELKQTKSELEIIKNALTTLAQQLTTQ